MKKGKASKEAKAKQDDNKLKEQDKQLNVKLKPEIYKALAIEAIKTDKILKKLVKEILKAYLEKRGYVFSEEEPE